MSSCLFCVVSTSASDCLEKLVFEMLPRAGHKTLLTHSLKGPAPFPTFWL